jgi:hypothetical protein
MRNWFYRATVLIKERWRRNKWLVVYECFNYTYDYLFYGYMVFTYGIAGGAIAATGSLVQNLSMFWLYDRMGVDWMSAQELRDLEERGDLKWYERLFVWFGKRKSKLWEHTLEPIVYVLALSRLDPLLVAVHFKKSHFTGLRVGDWLNVTTAVLIANFWWLLQIGAVAYGIHYLISLFR